MSSSRALRDVTNRNNGSYEASRRWGERSGFNEKNNAIIGGEGNGGIIYQSRIMVAIA
jgi:phosphomannomutase